MHLHITVMKTTITLHRLVPSEAWMATATATAVAALALTRLETRAETLFGLTTSGSLISFDSSSPGTLLNSVAISGLGGESLIGIDLRPNGGALYGVGSGNSIFTLNTATGAATLAGTLGTGLSGAGFGFDFNPVPDRLRVVGTDEQNLRINVGTGATLVDGSLSYAAGDANAGANPNVVGAAYANNVNGALTTTLYGIDSSLDILVTQAPPNAGTLNTVGALGIDTTGAVGFDISGSGIAYAALTDGITSLSSLYSINLSTGSASLIGQIGGGSGVYGLTAVPEPAEYGMMIGGALLGLAVYRRRRCQA